MKRWNKWGSFAIGLGLVITVAGRAVISQQPAPALTHVSGPRNAFDVLFEKVRPHLEEALGAKLDFTPQFRTASAAELLTIPDHDLDAHIRWHFPQLRGETLVRTRQIARQITAAATIAQHVDGSDIIVVASDSLPVIAAWDEELSPVNSEAFLQLALVHQVVIGHLDRRFQLAKLRAACCDAEEYEALQAVVEGRAQAVTRQVASKLGNQSLFPLLAKTWLRVPDDAPDPSIKAVSQTALHARYQAGVRGMKFWEALQIPEAEARVFTHTPRQMSVVVRPDLWMNAQAKNQPDLATVLQPLESALPGNQWQPMEQTWTPTMLAQVAGMLGAPKERAEKIARSWFEGRTLVWTQRERPERQVALSVVRHDGEAGARAYFDFAVELQRKQDTLPAGTCGPTIRVVESKSTAVKLAGFDEAVRNEKRIAFGDSEPLPVSLLLARSGSLVVECTWHGQSADPALAERLVEAVRTKAD